MSARRQQKTRPKTIPTAAHAKGEGDSFRASCGPRWRFSSKEKARETNRTTRQASGTICDEDA